jgi:hypothetical protein
MDNMAPKDIRLVAMKNAETQCIGLSATELENVKSFIEDEGTLADFIEVKEDADE